MTRQSASRSFLLSIWVSVVLGAGAVPSFGDMQMRWATVAGAGPNNLVDQSLAHDAAAGPNGTTSLGRWTGPARRGTFSGFALDPVDPTATVKVEVVLGLAITAPSVLFQAP